MVSQQNSLFQRPLWIAVFSLTAAILWGWAYPLIKLGFAEFQITPDMTASKMLFAGVRFSFSGLIILALARKMHRSFAVRKVGDGWFILLFALLNTTLHYAFFYFGLSHSPGARASILNSMSVFSVVILACLFFPSDKFTVRKVVGCLLGFAGILVLNVGKDDGVGFTLLGDGMIILNALCSAFASLLTRGLGRRVDVVVGTGYGLFLGGVLLVVPGLLLGGTLPRITPYGIAILLMLITISAVGFGLYNKLLTVNPVGKIAIYNSLIPAVGALSSCYCLGEPFYQRYAIAGTLAVLGIYTINRGKR